MTMAPRVEVYTKIACRAVHQAQGSHPPSPAPHFYEYLLPRADIFDPNFGRDDAPLALEFPDLDTLSIDECSQDPRVQGRAARIQACEALYSSSHASILVADMRMGACSCQDDREYPQCDHDGLAVTYE